MARPFKYNWTEIREAYESGLDKADIIKKHRVPNKRLLEKITSDGWIVKGHIRADIQELSEKLTATADNINNLSSLNQEIALERLSTLEQDNSLMLNNRTIAKMIQKIIVENRKDINIKNIKNVTGAIKDIESIANPYPETIIQNNNQNQQQNQNLTIEYK